MHVDAPCSSDRLPAHAPQQLAQWSQTQTVTQAAALQVGAVHAPPPAGLLLLLRVTRHRRHLLFAGATVGGSHPLRCYRSACGVSFLPLTTMIAAMHDDAT